MLRSPVTLLAFGFGSGCAPKAPGTVGTLVAVGLYLPLAQLPTPAYLAFCALSFALGCWLCSRAAAQCGVHDHPGIVFDEFVGFWVTMIAAPQGWLWIALGFGLFRLFDIVKPWPIGWLDRRVKGGFGIMVDDLLAGVMAAACLQALALWTQQN